ncbi:hypothetical protein BX616_000875 [Lobosporangium transversale]|nr:hypothetical protein BX616_000875 [Lobosporangium transversale]
MKIAVSSVILSLVAATAVFAAPAPALHQLEKRDWIVDKLLPLFTKAFDTLKCEACEAAISSAKDIALLNKGWAMDAARKLCPTLMGQHTDVCDGLVDLYGPVVVDTILKVNFSKGDGKYVCHALAGICSPPVLKPNTIVFPKPKPTNAAPPAHSGQRIEALHLSDWHVDELYAPGSEAKCDKPTCCSKNANSAAAIVHPASSWGEYSCDTPVKLTQDLLNFVPKAANVSFVILTGDVPPHDVWLQTKETVLPIEKNAYEAMSELPARVYPAVGNHESGPSNLADNWSRWLPEDAVNTVRNYGAYTASPAPGLRIISLNTNFCYKNNFHLLANLNDHDPYGELKWLIAQLQAAEDAGERVWIIGHVSPSQTDCLQNWSAQYYQTVQRYSPHVIAEQFFGHSHRDEFALFYGPGSSKSARNAIGTAWIGPSVTPFTNLNPGFRVYEVDTKSWNVFDSRTYIANLDQAANWDATGGTPNWHLEYSARQTYGAFAPVAANEPLTAAWWHNVTQVFENNDMAFQQFWTFRSKSAKREEACAAGSECKTDTICNLRAGKSSDACVSTTRRHKTLSHGGAPGSLSLPKHAESLQSWDKNLCGSPFGF